MYEYRGTPQNHAGTSRGGTASPLQLKSMGVPPEIQRRGITTLAPRMGDFAKRLRREYRVRRGDGCEDERGAELIEFAVVIVLLITLLYGIITYGVILAAQATVTQAAADAARSGIVAASANVVSQAEAQAGTDVGWMNKGTCGTSGTTITCVATEIPCPSNAANTCVKVTVTYNYGSSPLFPELPGLGVITPSTISSTNILQLSIPTGP